MHKRLDEEVSQRQIHGEPPSRKNKMLYDYGICKYVESAFTLISRWETSRWKFTHLIFVILAAFN